MKSSVRMLPVRLTQNMFERTMGGKIMKRKAKFAAVEKYSKTPKRNLTEMDVTTEFAREENPMKGANRNSQQGRKGRS